MSGLPFLQFYPGDWLKDTRALSPESKGAWIDVLCALHFSPTRGKLAMSLEGWARTIGQSPEKTRACIDELTLLGTCDRINGNGHVTLICRRMLRESITKEQTRQRVEKLRLKQKQEEAETAESRNGNGQCNAPVPKCNGEEARNQKPETIIGTNLPPASPPANELPTPEKTPRPRNELCDALAKACGCDPFEMTATAARTCAVKAAEIKKASPGVTFEEMKHRAELYRSKYQDAALTPSALCSHWAEFGLNGIAVDAGNFETTQRKVMNPRYQ